MVTCYGYIDNHQATFIGPLEIDQKITALDHEVDMILTSENCSEIVWKMPFNSYGQRIKEFFSDFFLKYNFGDYWDIHDMWSGVYILQISWKIPPFFFNLKTFPACKCGGFLISCEAYSLQMALVLYLFCTCQ